MKDRRSIRQKEYDYSQSGAYFVTVCTHNRECLFGEIVDGKMILNNAGRIVQAMWSELPGRFPLVSIRRVRTRYDSDTNKGGIHPAPTTWFGWQRNYYECVIRDENELNRARQYIIDNPAKWDMDEENPNVKPPQPR
jgi:putative transposase